MKKFKGSVYADIADRKEDDRIKIIVAAVKAGNSVAFITDTEPADKADRYIRKLQAALPGIVVHGKAPGPIEGAVTIKVGPPNSVPVTDAPLSNN